MIYSFKKNNGGGGSYVLPVATENTLGGVKVGEGLDINGGSLSTESVIDLNSEAVIDPTTTGFNAYTNKWYNIPDEEGFYAVTTNYRGEYSIEDEQLFVYWGDIMGDEGQFVSYADKYQVKVKIISVEDGVTYVDERQSEVYEGRAFQHNNNMGYLYPHGFDITILVQLCGYESDGVTPTESVLLGTASSYCKQLVENTSVVLHKDSKEVELATAQYVDDKIGTINNLLESLLS